MSLAIGTNPQNNEMPNMEELLRILTKLNMASMVQNQQNINTVLDYMAELEKNYVSVQQELSVVQEQLNKLQNKGVKNNFSELIGKMNNGLVNLQGQLREMKVTLNERAAYLVQKFKENGVIALNGMCEFLGIKDMLKKIREKMNNTVIECDASIKKIDTVHHELSETVMHAKNVGRAMAGKEVLEIQEEKEGKIFHMLKLPYQKLENFCIAMSEKLERYILRLENLEQTAGKIKEGRAEKKVSAKEKNSVLGKLQTIKSEQKMIESEKTEDLHKNRENREER